MNCNSRNLQELHYGANVDYRVGSPHLAYYPLRDKLVEIIRREQRQLADKGLAPTVLEIGAGHGGYTEPVLAAGGQVTAVEMSSTSVAELRSRFGTNPNFAALHTPDGSLSVVPSQLFSLGLAVSVLHHIPDYIAFVRQLSLRISPGGALVTLQDPLWYKRNRKAQLITRVAYVGWRLRRGNLKEGFSTAMRRVRHAYDDTKPGDVVEYHVVRQGVDEEALTRALSDLYADVQVIRYWSSQSRVAQRVGMRTNLTNTFGIVARDRKAMSSVE